MICKPNDHNFTGWGFHSKPCNNCGRTKEDLFHMAWMFMEINRMEIGRDPDNFWCDMCGHTDETTKAWGVPCPKCGSD